VRLAVSGVDPGAMDSRAVIDSLAQVLARIEIANDAVTVDVHEAPSGSSV
jgi:hypothetical protein